MGPTSPSSTRAGLGPRVDPPYYFEDYVGTRLRSPKEPLIVIPHTLSEETGPVFGDREIGELDHDLTRQHAASRSVSGSSSAGVSWGDDGKPLRGPAGRDLAGERRGPLRPFGRRPRRAARPELLGRRPLPDR